MHCNVTKEQPHFIEFCVANGVFISSDSYSAFMNVYRHHFTKLEIAIKLNITAVERYRILLQHQLFRFKHNTSLLRPRERLQSIVMSMCVCVCVCLCTCLSVRNQIFYACCLWPWFGPPPVG